MGVKEMDSIATEFSVMLDNQPWTKEIAPIYRYPSIPAVSGGLLGQRTLLEGMPVVQGVVARVNMVLARVARAREAAERELKK